MVPQDGKTACRCSCGLDQSSQYELCPVPPLPHDRADNEAGQELARFLRQTFAERYQVREAACQREGAPSMLRPVRWGREATGPPQVKRLRVVPPLNRVLLAP